MSPALRIKLAPTWKGKFTHLITGIALAYKASLTEFVDDLSSFLRSHGPILNQFIKFIRKYLNGVKRSFDQDNIDIVGCRRNVPK